MTNITNRIALTAAIEALSPDFTFDHVTTAKDGTQTTTTYSADDIVEKLTKMIEQLDKKASAPKKPTAKQVAAVEEAAEVLEALKAVSKAVTVSELMEACPDLVTKYKSNQKISALLRKLEEAGQVVKTIEKRKSYFKAAQ